ncbi:MAG TPA: DUF5666 domain-containing protein [Acidimicrobiales bacterium]|nr:DUF5666 domain-containing protein [Acidimicrobiales bacterium]
MASPASRSRILGSAVLAVSMAAALAACGGGGSPRASASGTSSTSTGAPAPSGSATGGSGGGRAFPGASGSVAAISGSSMEVQNPSTGQTTVKWTAATTFDQTVSLAASSLSAGECVTVTGTTSNGTITARSVAVTAAPSSGGCTAGFGAGGRGRFAGGARNGTVPPGSAPDTSRTPGRVPANIGFADGKVVSASATSLVLFGSSFAGLGSRPATSTPPTTAAPTDVTVTLNSSTTFTQVRPAAATNLAVGDCVVANGPADSTGAVTARTVRITSTGGKSCATGFGRFGGGAGAGAPAASGSANA